MESDYNVLQLSKVQILHRQMVFNIFVFIDNS